MQGPGGMQSPMNPMQKQGMQMPQQMQQPMAQQGGPVAPPGAPQGWGQQLEGMPPA